MFKFLNYKSVVLAISFSRENAWSVSDLSYLSVFKGFISSI